MSDYTPTTEQMRNNAAFGVACAVLMPGAAGDIDWPEPGFREEKKEAFDRCLASIKREAAAEAWSALADIVMPLYEAAEAVLCNGADPQTLMEPLAAVGRQTNPYRAAEMREKGQGE